MNLNFNLLRYPNLARQQRRRQQLWGLGSGFIGSLVLAWVGMEWLAISTGTLRHDLQQLQAQATQRQQQVQAAQSLARERQTAQRQQAHLLQVGQQQQTLVAWHAALQEEVPRHGLVLQRLHIEADRLELQAQAPGAQAMTAAGQRLSQRLGQPLAVTSLSEVAGAPALVPSQIPAVAFSWQGSWPRLVQTPAKGSAPGASAGAKP